MRARLRLLVPLPSSPFLQQAFFQWQERFLLNRLLPILTEDFQVIVCIVAIFYSRLAATGVADPEGGLDAAGARAVAGVPSST